MVELDALFMRPATDGPDWGMGGKKPHYEVPAPRVTDF
jgi:hypothetical protein